MSTQKTKNILLNQLKAERGKFTNSDEKVMQELIDELVTLGVYPKEPTKAMKDCGYSILKMVNCWGVDWFEYKEPFECPTCKADLRSVEGPPFKREIGMSDWELDSVVDFVCPDCYRSILDTGKQYDKEEFTKEAPIPEELKQQGE